MIDGNLNDYSSTKFSFNENELNASQSRRQLFPSIGDDDIDDFSYITPLNTSVLSPCSSVTSTDFELHLSNSDENFLIFNKNTIQDYIIIENICDVSKNNIENKPPEDCFRTPQSEKHNELFKEITRSPLFLSPAQVVPQSFVESPKKHKPKMSDLNDLQDTSGLNTIANKLIRNYSVERSPCDLVESNKRKLPFSTISTNKQMKFDQVSKVRTELFPKESSPLNENKKIKPQPVYLCNRKKKKCNFGEINAGVRHKIKKPKIKKPSKQQLIKSALDIIDNSALNDYLKSIENINSEFSIKQIQPLQSKLPLGSNFCDKENVTPNFKRPASSPVPGVSKKFFKSHRNSEVVMDSHLNFKINRDSEDFHVTNVNDKFDIILDTSDLVVPDKENLISSETIDKIVDSLDERAEVHAEQLVLTAHTSVVMSENSIHLHMPLNNCSNLVQKQVIDKSILLSPTSQMCNMTSGLALNSPTRNQHNFINESAMSFDENEKLFPIFCGKQNPSTMNCKTVKTNTTKKLKPLPKNQLLLDCGQKKFGAKQCDACNFVYHMGDPNDELIHMNYHNAGTILRFGGWKDERVVSQLPNSKIIKIIPTDPKPWLKKVKDLLEVINRDLGYYEMPVSMENSQIFLYIKKHLIVGCLVAEPKSTAYKLLSGNIGIDLCSELSYPIKCGVNRIWVSQGHRKEGIGTSLLNCLRGNFMYGYILTKEDIALSSPTESGKAFAAKYFNTSNFLIYT
ncbi:hypothetical protein FQR65_LT08967 [Abscondita terminalis]|nr:hypothetical protein FQR65_LT08967 [Abscondita terminalis]